MDAPTKPDRAEHTVTIGLRYMADFRCLGTECPDHCCHSGRTVPFDRGAYKRLRKAMDHSKADRAQFRRVLRRNPGSQSDGDYALVDFQGGVVCPWLDDQGLCGVERRFGADHLGSACRDYPRRFNARSAVSFELSGALSCPAAARACLTTDDAMALVPVVGQPTAAAPPAVTGEHPYIDEIREVAFSLLALPDATLASRLLLVGYFAHRVDARGGAVALSGDGLAVEVDHVALGETQRTLLEAMDTADHDLAVPLAALRAALPPGEYDGWPGLRDLLKCCWQGYGSGDLAAVAADYRTLRDGLAAHHGELVDRRLANWARNHWFQSWFTAADSLSAYSRDLVARYALIRFLLVSHPKVRAVVKGDAGAADAAAVVDEAVIEVVYKLTRALEQDDRCLREIERAVEGPGIAPQFLLLEL